MAEPLDPDFIVEVKSESRRCETFDLTGWETVIFELEDEPHE